MYRNIFRQFGFSIKTPVPENNVFLLLFRMTFFVLNSVSLLYGSINQWQITWILFYQTESQVYNTEYGQ
jgi:hypothetical protein